ncbi:uncharacterized protein F5147DRAFT_42750 [Suillus discolor]|uniref:Uncharacterized protein n=1 Tax=Suillus discolor TaxID=1912936 RepID=A0A9P7ET04_9AGAM|nr:uncharacterized protein F5147DRAFT_42750 [Suillus discolor]KAG2089041.1 hypothetical protein F5147DRAFT_42750 [Suillus discolor]
MSRPYTEKLRILPSGKNRTVLLLFLLLCLQTVRYSTCLAKVCSGFAVRFRCQGMQRTWKAKPLHRNNPKVATSITVIRATVLQSRNLKHSIPFNIRMHCQAYMKVLVPRLARSRIDLRLSFSRSH